MNKKRIKFAPLIAPILSALSLGSVCVGTTFALFAKDVTTSIHSEAGNIEVATAYTNLKAYSLDETDPNHELLKEVTTPGVFDAHGTYSLDTSTGALSLVGLVPGDKVTFHVKYTNNSNVDIKHKMFVRVSNDTGLYSGLNLSITRNENTLDLKTSLPRYFTKKLVSDTNKTIDEFDLTVELPVSAGIEFNNKRCDILVGFEVIQGNAWTEQPNTTLGFADSIKVEASGTTPAHFEHHVATKSEFKNILSMIKAGGQSDGINKADENTVYIIDEDIDFGGSIYTSADDLSTPFVGKLVGAGNGVTLSNLTVSSSSDVKAGLFRKFGNSTFENIKISNFNIDLHDAQEEDDNESLSFFGGMFPESLGNVANSNITFKNVEILANSIIIGKSKVAAFIGYGRYIRHITFENCVNRATVMAQGSHTAAAFIAAGQYGNPGGDRYIRFTNCSNYGDIHAESNGYAAGFMSQSQGSGTTRHIYFNNCLNAGDIYSASNDADAFISSTFDFTSPTGIIQIEEANNINNTGMIYKSSTGKNTQGYSICKDSFEVSPVKSNGSEVTYHDFVANHVAIANVEKLTISNVGTSHENKAFTVDLTSYDDVRTNAKKVTVDYGVTRYNIKRSTLTGSGSNSGSASCGSITFDLSSGVANVLSFPRMLYVGNTLPTGVEEEDVFVGYVDEDRTNTAQFRYRFDKFLIDSNETRPLGFHKLSDGSVYFIHNNISVASTDTFSLTANLPSFVEYNVSFYDANNILIASAFDKDLYVGSGTAIKTIGEIPTGVTNLD